MRNHEDHYFFNIIRRIVCFYVLTEEQKSQKCNPDEVHGVYFAYAKEWMHTTLNADVRLSTIHYSINPYARIINYMMRYVIICGN